METSVKSNNTTVEKLFEVTNAFLRGVCGEQYMVSPESPSSKFKVDVTTLGVLAPLFNSMEVEVSLYSISVERGMAYLTMRYKYTHPSGSNGYDVQYVVTYDYGVMTREEYQELRLQGA